MIGPSQRTLTTHNTHKRQTSMPSAGFKPAIPASEQPKTHALDRAASDIGHNLSDRINNKKNTIGLVI